MLTKVLTESREDLYKKILTSKANIIVFKEQTKKELQISFN